MKSGFGLARHGSPIGLAARHGLCNGRRVMLGLKNWPDVPARPDPFLIRVVLGLGPCWSDIHAPLLDYYATMPDSMLDYYAPMPLSVHAKT
jgi:hypothetical protein